MPGIVRAFTQSRPRSCGCRHSIGETRPSPTRLGVGNRSTDRATAFASAAAAIGRRTSLLRRRDCRSHFARRGRRCPRQRGHFSRGESSADCFRVRPQPSGTGSEGVYVLATSSGRFQRRTPGGDQLRPAAAQRPCLVADHAGLQPGDAVAGAALHQGAAQHSWWNSGAMRPAFLDARRHPDLRASLLCIDGCSRLLSNCRHSFWQIQADLLARTPSPANRRAFARSWRGAGAADGVEGRGDQALAIVPPARAV